MNKQFIAFCIVFFALTRLYLLFFLKPHNSDISLYATYAYEYLLASKQKVSFYRLHVKRIEVEQLEAIKNGLSLPDEEQKIIPYPPLAIQMLRIPSLFIKTDAAWTRQSFTDFADAYQSVFRRMLFLFDLVNFILILSFLTKRKMELSEKKRTTIALCYIVGVLTMPHILYDRLDLAVGTLLLLASALLLTYKKYCWSFIALAAAVNYKISPIILVPLFALGSIAVAPTGKRPDQAIHGFPWKLLLLRSAICTGFILAFFAPFAIIFGKASLSAFIYQNQRGLHVESFYSAIILFLSAFYDLHCSVGFGYGSFTLQSLLSKQFAHLSTVFTLFSLTGIFIILYRWYVANMQWKAKRIEKERKKSEEKLAVHLLVNGQLLCVSALIVFSKNFSPQYLFWLLPLLCFMDFQSKGALKATLLYLVACVLSTIIFPYCYFSDIVGRFTPLGKLLLVLRASVVVWFMICVLISFRRDTHPAPLVPVSGKKSGIH